MLAFMIKYKKCNLFNIIVLKIKDTLIYYPAIDIPDGPWIRQSLLYWDNIASIIPGNYKYLEKEKKGKIFRDDIDFLLKEGIYHPINPDYLLKHSQTHTQLIKEIKELMENEEFKKFIAPKSKRKFEYPIYQEKLTHTIFRIMQNYGLATDKDAPEGRYLFEKIAYQTYMSLLAYYIAITSEGVNAIGTDRKQNLATNLISQPLSKDQIVPVVSTIIEDIIPIPSVNTPLKKIVEFRRKHKDQLREFQLKINEFTKALEDCLNEGDKKQITKRIKSEISNFQKQIEIDITRMGQDLKSSFIDRTLGYLQAFIEPSKDKIISAAMGILVGPIVLSTAPTIVTPVLLYGAAGLISVYLHANRQRDNIKKINRSHPFSYIYDAEKEFNNKTR